MLHVGRPSIALASAVGVLSVLGFVNVGAGSAHAYGNPVSYAYALVDTDNCNTLATTLDVVDVGPSCWVQDFLDDTSLVKDPGGVGINFGVYFCCDTPEYKVEFHPYGEHLWVYDAENDGDTIYAELIVSGVSQGVFAPPGTSADFEYRDYNLSFAEGADVRIVLWDNSNKTDHIETIGGMKA